MIPFILGSSSPARLTTLRHAGLAPVVVRPDVDEDGVTADSAVELTMALAELKAGAVMEKVCSGQVDGVQVGSPEHPTSPVVVACCDSLLELEGRTYGKPGTPEAAVVRWHRMRGRKGVLVTGHYVAVIHADGTLDHQVRVAQTEVTFANLTEAEIAAYAATGEPEKVAGAFTIDGYGGAYITKVSGDPHNVIGISLPLVRQMLVDLGVQWHDLWVTP